MLNKLLCVALLGISLNADVFEKVKNLLDDESYNTNLNLIKYTFNNQSAFMDQSNNPNYELITKKLEENNLLNLKLSSIQDIAVSFIVSDTPKNSIKMLRETLKSLGYSQYSVQEATSLDNSFKWSVKLKSQSAINPLLLSQKLQTKNCKISDIKREGSNSWIYSIVKN